MGTQELSESRGERPGLPSLIILTVSVDVNQHSTRRLREDKKVCAGRGGGGWVGGEE